MTFNQILRRIRRQHSKPELTPEARAFIDSRKHALDGWTEEDLDELTRRTLETPEAERAMREADEAIQQRRASRRPE